MPESNANRKWGHSSADSDEVRHKDKLQKRDSISTKGKRVVELGVFNDDRVDNNVDVDHHNMESNGLDDFVTVDAEARVDDQGPMLQMENEISEPQENMEFESEAAAYNFYNAYARQMGFSIRLSRCKRSSKDGKVVSRWIVCSKEGVPRKSKATKLKRAITRENCKATLWVKKQASGCWVVRRFIKEHTHELAPPNQVCFLRSHRQNRDNAKNLVCVSKGGASNTQTVLDYFKRMQKDNPAFYYAYLVDDDGQMRSCFWIDARSRMAYSYFGDVVTFTTYKTNDCQMLFAPFTGVNHHNQSISFGCALIVDETESSLTWLFETWLDAMFGRHPISIVTNQDKAIRVVIEKVFPRTCHRFCKSHILNKAQDKLGPIYRKEPEFSKMFRECINHSLTIQEFETAWWDLIRNYNLEGHEWLHMLYEDRQRWVPAYLRDTFFADMSTNERSETTISLFDGLVNSKATLREIVVQCGKVLDNRYEIEAEEDCRTAQSRPFTMDQGPLERQAGGIYTRKIYKKFQEEVSAMSNYIAEKVDSNEGVDTYLVEKYMQDLGQIKKKYIVNLNASNMEVKCSCKMFDFSGILCRHTLLVFRMKNILMLPSHYFLKRWTRYAKRGTVLDGLGDEVIGDRHEDLTSRYNSICRATLKLAEEGSKSIEKYNIAMRALNRAYKEVIGMDCDDEEAGQPLNPVNENQPHVTLCDAPSSTPKGRPTHSKYKSHLAKNMQKELYKCSICNSSGHNTRTCAKKRQTGNKDTIELDSNMNNHLSLQNVGYGNNTSISHNGWSSNQSIGFHACRFV
ncbi:protein FAR1-RELATED SEQUENCE 5-like isoform X2 [Magnolia sinica]|uniref:protein FAR1-RELATED SEQUENCE 5-like isoform X2 n=1 Tax=Magnolia sinica TaxID=86752 RepID=UPI002659D22E|nr:protein FAR1-RELATED SEQUENCE 5-like isoform X2 [Magnolia sinica]